MAQPVSSPITSTPNSTGQPWDATNSARVDRWAKLDDNAGKVSINTGRGGNHNWPSDGHWTQT